jgi:hypothetical protein
VDKHFTRLQACDLIGGYSAVGAANPQILGRLLLRQMVKKTWLLALHALGPDSVVVEEMREMF